MTTPLPPLPDATPRPRPGWFRAGAARPPAPTRRLAVRVALALSSLTAILTTVAVVGAASVVPTIGARRVAREMANRELASQLRGGETIIARVYASQRRWTDFYRESFGVVAATDRRVVYVGAPPLPLLRPREDGPMDLLTESYPYDAAFTLEPQSLWRGRLRGLALRTPARQVDFIVDDAAWPGADAVVRATRAGRSAVTRANATLDAALRPPALPAEQFDTHVVRRGETLTALARRYRTTTDILQQLNQLPSGEIQAGQRLRVPRVDPPPATLPDSTR